MTTQLTGPAAAPGNAHPGPDGGRGLDRVVPWAAPAWLLAYGVLRAYWAAGNQPRNMSPAGPDLVVFTGWRGVALCGAATAVLLALAHPAARHRTGRVLRLAAWTAAAALAAAAAMLLLDVIGAVLPGLGVPFHPLGALSRAACAAAAAGPLGRTPAWAYRAAYLAVAGCAARVAAQAAVGFGASPLSGGASALLFEAGFVLGGTLLPLALVHPFGRTWPRPLPVLGGRRVPRRLVLWPAAAVSAGLTVYFGLMLLLMCWERLHGRDPFPPEGGLDLPEAFFWAAVPAYVLWGAGMAVAARAYARRTRAPCP
ncbi:hypothetical protein, partial [Actinomadura sp. 7K534]|uniref:hypothetical protein n=1 Tax=Actinomadura sp. 7K534 TaxID=2530366 RepID=UPI001046ECC4